VAASALTERDWQIRMHVYEFFVEQAHPPTAIETAQRLRLSDDEARGLPQAA